MRPHSSVKNSTTIAVFDELDKIREQRAALVAALETALSAINEMVFAEQNPHSESIQNKAGDLVNRARQEGRTVLDQAKEQGYE